MTEELSDLFFRGAEAPSVAMFVMLALAAGGAAYVGFSRARERFWIEMAVAMAVVAAAIGEAVVLVTATGVARFDRVAVLALVAMGAALLVEDIRAGGPAAGLWRGVRAALKL